MQQFGRYAAAHKPKLEQENDQNLPVGGLSDDPTD
jgi:hypothetical protein